MEKTNQIPSLERSPCRPERNQDLGKLPVICMRNLQMLYVLLFDPEIIAVFVMQQWLVAAQLIRSFALACCIWTYPLKSQP